MFIKLKIFIYNLLFIRLRIWFLVHFDPLIKSQINNTRSIPIIIINFNQLFYLNKLITFLVQREFENIVVIDNDSTYPPLLDYYKTLPKNVTIEYMHKNFGHMVFFESVELQKKYGQGFYVVTDADIVPNENLPEDFMNGMLDYLIKNFTEINKVGFALKVDDLLENNKLKEKVIKWESKFWKKNISKCIYDANIDTTFALYKPGYPVKNNKLSFYRAHRFACDYTAQHGGWYIDYRNLTGEQVYYLRNSSNSFSWKSDLEGKIKSNHDKEY